MKKSLLFASLILSSCISFAQLNAGSQQVIQVPLDGNGATEHALIHLPNDYSLSSSRYPLLIFLHGMGEAGTDLSMIYNNSGSGGPAYFIANSTFPSNVTNPRDGLSYKFIVVSPQAPTFSTSGQQLDYILNYLITQYRVDTNRIYLTGLSAGGRGVFDYTTHTSGVPTHKPAAMVIMSQATGAATQAQINQTIADSVRVWGFGSETDIYGIMTHLYMSGDYGGNSCNCSGLGNFGRFTGYAGGHCCWNQFYDPAYTENINGVQMNIYQWLLQFTRSNTDPTAPPTVSTYNQFISIGNALLGSTATSGNPVSVKWTKFLVPNQIKKKVVVIGSSTAAGNGSSSTDSSVIGKVRNYYIGQGLTDSVVNLAVAGSNIFSLNITSSLNRGGDIYLVAFPTNGYDTASISTILAKYQEIKDSCDRRGIGFFASGTQPRDDYSAVNQLKLIEINDSLRNRFGARFIDFLTPVMNPLTNRIKTAYSAGDGIHLNDAGHEVLFQKVRAANIFQFGNNSGSVITNPATNNTSVTGLTAGLNKFQVSVIDNKGYAASAVANITVSAGQQVQVINVNMFANNVPYNNAAWNNWLYSAQTSNLLNYSDGSPSTIYVSASQGLDYAQNDNYVTMPLCPNEVGFYAVKLFNKTIYDTIKGLDNNKRYDLRFYSSHNTGFAEYTRYVIGNDSVDINNNNNTSTATNFVNKAPVNGMIIVKISSVNFVGYINGFTIIEKTGSPANQPPVANAGPDQTIALPATQVTLDGSASTDDHNIVSYQWTKLSGIGGAITNPSQASTGFTGLSTGTYVVELKVVDDSSAVSKDTVVITVNQTTTCNGRKFIATPGYQNSYYDYNGSGFNLQPGDTLVLGAQYQWGLVEIHDRHGTPTCPIVIINSGGQTLIGGDGTDGVRRQLKLENCSWIKFTGSGSNDRYGFKIRPYLPNHAENGWFAVSIVGKSRCIDIDSVEISNAGIGISVEQDGICDTLQNFPYNVLDSISIHHNYIHRIWNEGMYLGNTNPDNQPPPYIPGFTPRPVICEQVYAGAGKFLHADSSIRVKGNYLASFAQGRYISIQNTSLNNTNNCKVVNSSYLSAIDSTIINVTNYDGSITNETDASINLFRVYYYKSARAGHMKIYNNFVDSTGRGGIQLGAVSEGLSEIYGNTVKHSGMNGDEAQGTGISIGGYSKAYIHDNTVCNTFTWGIASLGGSGTGNPIRIENNNIDSSGYLRPFSFGNAQHFTYDTTTIANSLNWPYSIFMKTATLLNLDSTGFWIRGNVLGLRKSTATNTNNGAGIGFANYTNWFHKSGNYICSNVNVSGGSPTVNVELGYGMFPVLYNTDCNNITYPPTANAGPDKTITLPVNSVTLNGSGTDPDGTVVSYQWTKVGGPSTYLITNPTSDTTLIQNLVQGTYQFELKVTDNQGATGRDTVNVTVNPASNQNPVANAGIDQVIQLPVSSVTVNGSGTDADGTIVAYTWTKISGPATYNVVTPNTATTIINGLVQGVYIFRLTVTDNQGATGFDDIQVTVNAANVAPTANAGADKTIQLPTSTVTLTGSGTDADGTIASYAWTKVSGPATYTIASPAAATTAINGLVQGVYVFRLTVTDNQGATGYDDVQVTVNAANVAPTANAGADKTIQLPTNTVTLAGSGTDADGTIASYAWTKVSGPATYTIASPAAATTAINGLVQGVYVFRLTVTDNQAATGFDDVQVTVNAANIPPTANAGPDKIITLPTNTVTITGTGSDPDGTVAAYLWTKIAGPATYTIVTPAQGQTIINNLVQGAYQFELTVTDNQGATGKDTVTVNVNPAANINPIANAGPDQVVALPINFITLSGNGTDPDGTITGYLWTRVAGPSGCNIINAGASNTNVTGLVQGIYQFELTVTDNSGAIAKDTMIVTVNPLPNRPPTANAGADQTIQLPVSIVTVIGSGTDADGTITSYFWTKISGPATYTIVNPSSATTTINNLVQGVYQFELKVIDNSGAPARDTVQITVLSIGNQPPVANAGVDQNIMLPVSSVRLNGSGTDADGTITSYQWTKASGPSTYTIVSPTAAVTDVINLVQGIYQFVLTVTDNSGATASDTVYVIVNPPAQLPNILPTANAGANFSITLPVSDITTQASASDPDGTIASYQWTKIDGPLLYSIVNPTQLQTDIRDLIPGHYTFELKVTDNRGAVARDTLTIDVADAALVYGSIFPNPATSKVNIAVNAAVTTDQTIITIFGLNGQPIVRDIFTRSTQNTIRQYDVTRWAKGYYLVEIRLNDIDREVKRFVVQ